MSSAVRRNGLLSSCEPCRKSKLRCDHALPCSRCRRRRKPALCVYHPAPMTRSLDTDAAVDYPSGSTVSGLPPGVGADLTSPPSRSWTGPLQNQNQHGEQPKVAACSGPLRDRYIADWSKRAASFPSAGVLGPTSYSAVFSESDDVARSSNVAGSLRDLKSLQSNLNAIDDGQIQLGAELLLILHDDFTLYEQMATTRFDQCEGYVFAVPVLRPIFGSIWRMLEDAIEDRNDPLPSLRKLSKSIFENSSQPVGVDSQTNPEDFFGSMPRKWEIVGLMFSIVGSSACLLPHSDLAALGAASLDRKGLGVVCVSAGEICLRFCDNSGVISEQLAWALLAHTSLLTFLYGDHDYRPWKMLGDLGTVLFALGFHQQEAFARLPLFLSEHRKRLVIGAYALDKELSTFLGRPPRLSWRHLDIDLPLDVDYNAIMAEPHVRDAELAKLDSDGWNTEQTISNVTYARAMYKMGPVREFVLEVSLNPRIYDDLEGKIAEIYAMSKKIRSQLPPTLRWDREKLDGLDEDRDKGYVTLGTHLNFLHCEFIMQRTLAKRKGNGSEALLNIAHEMLSVLLIAISHRSHDGRDNNTMAWTMSIFGLPSAGVLAIELLRQSQTPDPNPLFPRSEVIQNLSRFSADLEYVIWPHAGNYEICQQARKVIRHILDRVLSAPPAMPVPASSNSAMELDFASMDWLTTDDTATWLNQDSDFLKWVDSFDWGQELGR